MASWEPQWEPFHIFCMGFVHKLHTTLLFVFLSAIFFTLERCLNQIYINELQWRNVILGGPRFKIFEGPLEEVPKARVERRIYARVF
jgi:hypothetical protein